MVLNRATHHIFAKSHKLVNEMWAKWHVGKQSACNVTKMSILVDNFQGYRNIRTGEGASKFYYTE